MAMHIGNTTSLARMVAGITGWIIGGAMFIYALFQYATTPDIAVSRLLLSHGWHVAALALLTWGVLHVVLYRKVVLPTRDLYVKLYAVTCGDFRPVEVDTNIREILDIAESVNLMLKHQHLLLNQYKQGTEEQPVGEAHSNK